MDVSGKKEGGGGGGAYLSANVPSGASVVGKPARSAARRAAWYFAMSFAYPGVLCDGVPGGMAWVRRVARVVREAVVVGVRREEAER